MSTTEKKRGSERTGEGTPPTTGAEGGVIKEGTGDFAPGKDERNWSTAPGEKTVIVQDAYGNDVKVPAGSDGKTPVTPNNPPQGAMLGGGRASESEGNTEAKDPNEGVDRTKKS